MAHDRLEERTRALLDRAMHAYQDSPRALGWLRAHVARFDEPVRLAVVGPRESGKSTVVNALCGEQVTPAQTGGAPLLWYRATTGSTESSAVAFPQGGRPVELPVSRQDKQLRVDTSMLDGMPLDRVEVSWPNRALRELTLIDTPALESPTLEGAAQQGGDEEASGLAHAVERIYSDADAVLYLLPRPQYGDLGFLRAVQEHPIARAAPVNMLAVVTRADELGGGRVDALISARQVARRHRREAEIGGLCQDVVPMSGMLACAGRTLREPEFDAFSELARLPRKDIEPYLLSVDRFAGDAVPGSVPADVRVALLGRFGLFGVRLVLTLLRRGSMTLPALAAELVQRSGLGDLRDAIENSFVERRPVLKARSALIALEVVLRMEPRPAAAALAGELERVMAGAHEFRELRLLAALRGGRIVLPAELRTEALRLLGDVGAGVAERFGVEPGEDPRPAAFDALQRWRAHAEDGSLPAAARRAAAVVARGCEGVVATPVPA
ncbi:50S ribosome-binding GTPase [Amycolatopsis marina]|uniref:50S ribosome-binding GTPase n=1 Tax=Amycolatopsis marina TaxID=490629 RepID=A0A1I0V882_9PSEU|nr:GTPase [Amycolatopsis marina]SFA72462.1 50S ribosome-binding GTPase [Amycolatopsis marina]